MRLTWIFKSLICFPSQSTGSSQLSVPVGDLYQLCNEKCKYGRAQQRCVPEPSKGSISTCQNMKIITLRFGIQHRPSSGFACCKDQDDNPTISLKSFDVVYFSSYATCVVQPIFSPCITLRLVTMLVTLLPGTGQCVRSFSTN